ncbi:MAG TPA: hypothetical protein VGL53_10780 [Bryobacteraceae bacterium]|jgi:hypothetical protein
MTHSNTIRTVAVATALIASTLTLACTAGVRVGYREYDPYGRDYHVWAATDAGYYNQWAIETHHDPHRDFRRLSKSERGNYWKWRHDHPDHH